MRAFSRKFRAKFLGLKTHLKDNNSEMLLKYMSTTLDVIQFSSKMKLLASKNAE